MASSLRSGCSSLLRSVARPTSTSSVGPSSSVLSSSSRVGSSSSRSGSSLFPSAASSSRAFSSSPTLGSHIGGAAITYPASCKLVSDLVREEIAVEGPLGIERVAIKPYVRLFHSLPATADGEGILEVAVDDQTVKAQRQMWGTTRQLLANAVTGVTEGFRLPVKLIGVGFRAAVEDAPVPPGGDAKLWAGKKRLNLKLGFSHPILLDVPDHVTVEVPIPTKFFISGTSLGLVSQFAAVIRSHRPPEPYRGKVRRDASRRASLAFRS